MPQNIAIDDTLPLTVRRFLDLGGRVAMGRRREVLESVGVRHLLDQPLQRISGGEMQRVLLGRAVLRNPDLLVLDEPAQGLDVVGHRDKAESGGGGGEQRPGVVHRAIVVVRDPVKENPLAPRLVGPALLGIVGPTAENQEGHVTPFSHPTHEVEDPNRSAVDEGVD